MSPRLMAYLLLEQGLLLLNHDAEEQHAESLRSTMDGLWYALTDEERAELNSRGSMEPTK